PVLFAVELEATMPRGSEAVVVPVPAGVFRDSRGGDAAAGTPPETLLVLPDPGAPGGLRLVSLADRDALMVITDDLAGIVRDLATVSVIAGGAPPAGAQGEGAGAAAGREGSERDAPFTP